MSNKPTLGILDGERGLPNVNRRKAPSTNRVLVAFFFVVALLLTTSFSYFSYSKKGKDTQDVPEAKQIKSSLPERTFELPQSAAGIEKESSIRNNIESQTDVDKSSAALMAPKEQNGSGQDASIKVDTSEKQGASTTISSLLTTTPTPMQSASLLKNRDYLLTKDSFIDCALQTRLDSTVPGMTSCVVTRNIYGDSGKILLVERGSTVSGEYQSSIKQGQARIFVVWNRIKTPNGVVVSLDSPGADPLGGSGIPGYVDTHFWQRFGGAILMSLLQDASAAVTASLNNRDNPTITLNNTTNASEELAVEALKNSINIPPTLYKNQGDRVGIYVARDLDFKSVYDLKLR